MVEPHAFFGQHAVGLELEIRPGIDQLHPVADQLPEFPQRRRGDPRLRQTTHPQQISQQAGVSVVLLHPLIGERLHPQRMGQMHLGAAVRKTSTAQYQP